MACVGVMFSCSSTKTLNCGEGKAPVQILKNPEKAYKKYQWAKSFEVNAKATIDVIDKVKVDEGNLTVKNKIENFREKITNETIRMEMLVRENAKAYNAGACYKDVRDKFFEFQDYVTEKNTELEKLRIDLQKTINSSGIGNDDPLKILTKIGKFEENYVYETTGN